MNSLRKLLIPSFQTRSSNDLQDVLNESTLHTDSRNKEIPITIISILIPKNLRFNHLFMNKRLDFIIYMYDYSSIDETSMLYSQLQHGLGEIMQLSAKIVIDFGRMRPWLGTFLEGTGITLVLSLVTVVMGLVIGLGVTFLRRSRIKPLSFIAKTYTLVIRGTPLLLQLYMWLYAFPQLGLRIPGLPIPSSVFGSREFATAIVALGINSGAYVAELLRGGLDAVDKGQTEAARSLGLSKTQSMRYVVIPQALRVILPGLGNEFIQMIKESSIVSTVGIFDVMYAQTIVKSATYAVFEPLIIVAAIYFVLTSGLTFILSKLERKFNAYSKNTETV